jgi:hypothetical protein
MRRTASNITTSSEELPLTNASEETGEKTMKAIHGGATKRTFGIFIFVASLLLEAAVADAVLDWSAIAMNTIGGCG